MSADISRFQRVQTEATDRGNSARSRVRAILRGMSLLRPTKASFTSSHGFTTTWSNRRVYVWRHSTRPGKPRKR